MKTLQLYIKNTSNCQGLGLTSFEVLSKEWTGKSILIPFGSKREYFKTVGWTDLFCGSSCPIHVVKVRQIPSSLDSQIEKREAPPIGILVYGGNSGIRVLDENAIPIGGFDDHLPKGYGMPCVWIEDIEDLPSEVQEVLSQSPN